LKPDGQGLSGDVHGRIKRQHRVRALRAVATAYQRFLDENPNERAAMETWESATLVYDVESDRP